MNRVRIACMALMVSLMVSAISDAADKSKRKKGKHVSGLVKSVDLMANKITVAVKVKKKETADKTYGIAEGATVTINGEKKTLGDIKEGVKAQLTLSEDGKAVKAIKIGKKKKKKKKDA